MARIAHITAGGEHIHSGVARLEAALQDREAPDGASAMNLVSGMAERSADHPFEGSMARSASVRCSLVEPLDPARSNDGHVPGHFFTSRSQTQYDAVVEEAAWNQGAVGCRNRLSCRRILIVDDCVLHRENLAAVLAVNGASKPAVAWDLPSLCASLEEATPDIVLLSIARRNNVTLLRSVREKCPCANVIVVGISEDDESEIVSSAEVGVAGYHLRTESLDDLLALINRVCKGESLCSPKVSAILLKRLSTLAAERQFEAKELVLTTREVQILRMLELGMSNRDIADQLCIALHTVKNHVHSVLSKLGASTRGEAAAFSRASEYTSDGIGD